MSFSIQSAAYLLLSSIFSSGMGSGLPDRTTSFLGGISDTTPYTSGTGHGSMGGYGFGYGPGTTPMSEPEPETPEYTDTPEYTEDAEPTISYECDEIEEWIVDLEDDCDAGDDAACDGLYDAYDAACTDMAPGDFRECTAEDVEDKALECECATKRAANSVVVKTFEANLRELRSLVNFLNEAKRELDMAERNLLGASDNYVGKIAGHCAVAGIEAFVVAKSIPATRAACAEGLFGAQCLAAGFTTKEITRYLATNSAVKASVFALVAGTVKISAEVSRTEESSFIDYIPIFGEWCRAHKWSGTVFSAPEMIRIIGNQRMQILRKKHELLAKIRTTESMIRRANAKLRADGC